MKEKRYKIGLIGYFAVGKSKSGGQEAKTCAVARTLRDYYSPRTLRRLDTGNWKKHPFKFLCRVLHIIRTCRIIIIFPAQKSVRVIVPLLILFGKTLKRKSLLVAGYRK